MSSKALCKLSRFILHATIALLMCVIGCTKGASKTSLAINEIQLPESAQLVKMWMTGNSPNPIWTEFSGSYPSSWPGNVNLPMPSYFLKGVTLTEGPALNSDAAQRGVRSINFKGVAVNTPSGLITYFRSELKNAGCSITGDRALTHGNGGVHDITGSLPDGKTFLFKIRLDKDLGKYAMFSGYIQL